MVVIDDINIKDLKLSLSSRPSIPSPEQDIEFIDIKGRNGSLTKKYGFKDIQYKLTFDFLEDVSFRQAFREAKMAFYKASKLIFTEDYNIYHKIKAVSIDDATNDILEYGQFTVTFTLDPFAYEPSNMIEITRETKIMNFGFESEPYIKCYCSGTGNIYIGNQILTILDINGFIEFDSEKMNAYRNDNGIFINLNNHMVGDFLLIPNGVSDVKFDGDITKLEIDPRWRWI